MKFLNRYNVKWMGRDRTVFIGDNNPENSDIPSYEHGFVHVYDVETTEYIGFCGTGWFAENAVEIEK